MFVYFLELFVELLFDFFNLFGFGFVLNFVINFTVCRQSFLRLQGFWLIFKSFTFQLTVLTFGDFKVF
jgi:hypothetical protein